MVKKHLSPKYSKHVFKSGVNTAIIANIDRSNLIYKQIREIRKTFNLPPDPNQDLHLTLHMINFNYNHPFMKKYDILNKLKNYIKHCFKFIKNTRLLFTNVKKIGKGDMYVIGYKLNNKYKITQFRVCLYDKLAKLCGLQSKRKFIKQKQPYILNDGTKVYVYCTPDGIPLYGIHEYYYGRGYWEPHISLFKESELNLLDVNIQTNLRSLLNIKCPNLLFNYSLYSNLMISNIGAVTSKQYFRGGNNTKRKNKVRTKRFKKSKKTKRTKRK